jgi:hypothetical protein
MHYDILGVARRLCLLLLLLRPLLLFVLPLEFRPGDGRPELPLQVAVVSLGVPVPIPAAVDHVVLRVLLPHFRVDLLLVVALQVRRLEPALQDVLRDLVRLPAGEREQAQEDGLVGHVGRLLEERRHGVQYKFRLLPVMMFWNRMKSRLFRLVMHHTRQVLPGSRTSADDKRISHGLL